MVKQCIMFNFADCLREVLMHFVCGGAVYYDCNEIPPEIQRWCCRSD